MNVLSINNLTKYYKTIRALNNVSFVVPEACTFGILGPNGSGKTTLLGIITEVLKPSSGSFSMLDNSNTPKNILRKGIGTLLETPNFYHYLSAERNLQISAEIKGCGLSGIDAILKKVGLYERRDSKFSTFSLGMKQRLAIGAALLGDPKILIFDEPTNGLDPEGIAEIRTLIKELGTEGRTIIMASHLLDEVEKVCTHVAILKSGELLTAGKADEVLANEDIVELSAADVDKLYAALKEMMPAQKMKKDDTTVYIYFESNGVDTEDINKYCFSHDVVLTKLLLKKKSLESMFLEIIANPKPEDV